MNDEQQERLNTRLKKAIQTNNKKAAEELLNKGADKNIISDKESNFLINSVMSGSSEMAKFLIDNKANVNQKDKMSRTPLHYVRDEKMAKILLDAQADLKLSDVRDQTPLNLANARGKTEVVEFLKQAEKKIDQQNNQVDTKKSGKENRFNFKSFTTPSNAAAKRVVLASKKLKNKVIKNTKNNTKYRSM